ncbi:MAG: hypothetical protein LRZ85_10205 [Alphaproteobacteria bacterium]|nr:hypothetical protein [Alphaproteobacteria bacterium]MCD8520579.1 hypothetical protein [Alphaproteobacteria bacterium]MCD8525811.1 hypothetical protein [Alphaproteobacteria bacterium]MCD8571430.1 hypothetical protein [Alphaproteobacteria bacterium]
MIRSFICCALTIILFVSALPALAQNTARFFESLPDIPLMEGLTELPSESSLFDKPEGRIAEVTAAGSDITFEAVTVYYKQSLPQFGWQLVKTDPLLFKRDNEELRLEVIPHGGQTNLRILISPR